MNTAANHNASLTGRIETVKPAQVYSVSEQKPAARTKPLNKQGRGATPRAMRLNIARKAIRDLETNDTLSAQERLALMKIVERMTAGKKVKKQPKKSVFET